MKIELETIYLMMYKYLLFRTITLAVGQKDRSQIIKDE